MKLDTSNPVLLFLVGQVITAGGTYAAIRADLREAIVTAQTAAQQAERANTRIDGLQGNRTGR